MHLCFIFKVPRWNLISLHVKISLGSPPIGSTSTSVPNDVLWYNLYGWKYLFKILSWWCIQCTNIIRVLQGAYTGVCPPCSAWNNAVTTLAVSLNSSMGSLLISGFSSVFTFSSSYYPPGNPSSLLHRLCLFVHLLLLPPHSTRHAHHCSCKQLCCSCHLEQFSCIVLPLQLSNSFQILDENMLLFPKAC